MEVYILLGPIGESAKEINWGPLLPAEYMTRWLALDPAAKIIQIDPSAAVPDRA